MLAERIIASLIFIPILFLALYFGGGSFLLVITGTAILGLVEFYDLQKNRANPQYETGIIMTLLLCISVYKKIFNPALILIVLLFTSLIIEMFKIAFARKKARHNALDNIAITIFGVLYVAFLLSYFFPLRAIGVRFLFLAIVSTWACDTSAYFIGSKWGKHKLIPRISPLKSVEGAIGGICASLGVFLMARLWMSDFSLENSIILGILIGVFALLGDLCESFLKRETATKDSSDFIPGHGGILDRFDSLLFTAPLLYYFLTITGLL